MNFYNNIFASAYRVYNKYEKAPRYKAASFVFMCLFGTLSLLLLFTRNLLSIDLSTDNSYGFKLTLFFVSIALLLFVWQYYSESKVGHVINKFEQKPLRQRKMWGYISVVFFIIQWVIFIF